jgi:hypothetical protein
MLSCDITVPSMVEPLAAMACGLSGLVAGELTKLVLREWRMPCTMEVLRLWAYDCEGLRSMERSGLEVLLATTTAGVCERGDRVRDEAVSARPRVTDGSREGMEGPKGPSAWCDGFPARGRGEGAAAGTAVSKSVHARQLAASRRRRLDVGISSGLHWAPTTAPAKSLQAVPRRRGSRFAAVLGRLMPVPKQ